MWIPILAVKDDSDFGCCLSGDLAVMDDPNKDSVWKMVRSLLSKASEYLQNDYSTEIKSQVQCSTYFCTCEKLNAGRRLPQLAGQRQLLYFLNGKSVFQETTCCPLP